MKLKLFFITLLFAFTAVNLNAQKLARDSLKDFALKVVQKAVKKANIKSLAVWDFTDIHKSNFLFGNYVAEQFSIYAGEIETLNVMDRQNLKSLVREQKLKEDKLTEDTTFIKFLKLKNVNALVVGSVIIVGTEEFQVVVKIVSTNNGETISSGEEFFPIDKRTASIMSTPATVSSNLELTYNPNEKIDNTEEITKSNTNCSDCKGLGTISNPSTCTNCFGKGITMCKDCSGVGKFICKSCGGDGKGPIYPTRGIYSSTCSSCGGTGSENCKSCRGNGTNTCSECKGKKVVLNSEVCSKCNGKGKILTNTTQPNNKNTKVTCSDCNGEGIIKIQKVCSDCSGNGSTKCERCNGIGSREGTWRSDPRVMCTSCSGKGSILCGSCKGKGKLISFKNCEKCNGKG